MKNLLKITLLLSVFVLTKANVFGQETLNIPHVLDENQYNGAGDETPSEHTCINDKRDGILVITIKTTQTEDFLVSIVGVDFEYNSGWVTSKGGECIIPPINSKLNQSFIIKVKGVKKSSTYGIGIDFKYKVGINENILTKEVQLYSYDNNVVLVNQNNQKNLTVDIYTLTGQLVKTEQINGLYDKSDLQTNLPSGIYVVRVNDGVNQISKKLSINKGR